MSRERIELGREGEDAAVTFLKKNGYKIVRRNYRSRLGEVDIIARDGSTTCFIEVKTRASDFLGPPELSVTETKQHQIAKAALGYLKTHALKNEKCRFDVVSVLLNADRQTNKVKLIKDAFSLNSLYTY